MSDFGKGFSYCLGLFLVHSESAYENRFDADENGFDVDRWFNGAADHLFEFDAENCKEELRERCLFFKEKCLGFLRRNRCVGSPSPAPILDDVWWALQEAKNILLEYDRLNGFEVEKAEWEG